MKPTDPNQPQADPNAPVVPVDPMARGNASSSTASRIRAIWWIRKEKV